MLREIFKELGIPRVVKSDNGPAFISQEFKDFAIEMGFKHQKITPRHPHGNGGCERFMGNINKVVRCAKVMNENWRTQLEFFIKNYRASIHSSTGCTPNDLMSLPDDIELPTLNIQPKPCTNVAKINDAISKKKMQMYADAYQHTKHTELNIGDQVLHKWDHTLSPKRKAQ